jgi:hypothetical protein
MRDNRKHTRYPTELNVNVQVLSAPGQSGLHDREMTCRTRDVSAMGMRLTFPFMVPIGTVLELSLDFEDLPQPFLHRGHVCWVLADEEGDGFQLGIEFSLTSEHTRQAWRVYLEKVLAGDCPAVPA